MRALRHRLRIRLHNDAADWTLDYTWRRVRILRPQAGQRIVILYRSFAYSVPGPIVSDCGSEVNACGELRIRQSSSFRREQTR